MFTSVLLTLLLLVSVWRDIRTLRQRVSVYLCALRIVLQVTATLLVRVHGETLRTTNTESVVVITLWLYLLLSLYTIPVTLVLSVRVQGYSACLH